MAESTLWWLLAGAAVAAELLTGTFYLLMLAIGMGAGALAAHAGGSMVTQLVAAALVGGGAVAGWYLVRRHRREDGADAGANPDMNLDIGGVVNVERWQPDGTALVKYRGANWTVQPAEGEPQYSGAYRVREVVGSRLVVEKI